MNRMVKVVYENNVFRPLHPVEGWEEGERGTAWIVLQTPDKKGLEKLIGTLTEEEAEDMRTTINKEAPDAYYPPHSR